MDFHKKLLSVMISVVCAAGIPTMGEATQPELRLPFDAVLEPMKHPDSAGPLRLSFRFSRTEYCPNCDEVTITLLPQTGLTYSGPESWTISLGENEKYEKTIDVTLPPNDTSGLQIRMQSGGLYSKTYAYFVATDDSVEFWKGKPTSGTQGYSQEPLDTTKYEVRIDLSEQWRYDMIMKRKDSIAPVEATPDSGIYIIRVTRHLFDGLKREGFKVEYIQEPPPRKPGRPGVKGTTTKLAPDSGESSRVAHSLLWDPLIIALPYNSMPSTSKGTSLSPR
jgi:hypothetical protein